MCRWSPASINVKARRAGQEGVAPSGERATSAAKFDLKADVPRPVPLRSPRRCGRDFLTTPSRPEQNGKNNHPNNAPPNPCDVGVSRLPFEDFFMDGH
jgi:hypothetical protein